MISCKFNYDVNDNVKSGEILFKEQNRKKTNLVSLLVVLVCAAGVISSISNLINGNGNWWLGILSVGLLICYFLVDILAVKFYASKQKKFFMSSNLKNVTKVEIEKDGENIKEKFFIGDKLLGENSYDIKNLTTYKEKDNNIYLIFENTNIVMIKKNVLTEKNYLEYKEIYNYLKKKKSNFKK